MRKVEIHKKRGRVSNVSDYLKIEKIIIVNNESIQAELTGTLVQFDKIGMLFNSMQYAYNGIIYIKMIGESSYRIYNGIGGRKTYPDAVETLHL